MARTRRTFPVLVLALALATTGACRGGCGQHAADRAAAVQGRLALFPVDTQVVVTFDFARLRGSPAAAKLAGLSQQIVADGPRLDEFKRRTGLDPMSGIDSVTMAFPDEARRSEEVGIIVRAPKLDQARLIAYARDDLQKKGDDLVSTMRGPLTVWSAKRDPRTIGFFPDENTFVLASGGWGPRMAALAADSRPGDSAATNMELVHLVERAAGTHAIWAAALVPPETRRKVAQEPGFQNAAAVQTLALGIDIAKGLDAVLIADMATAADAQGLAEKARQTLRDAKQNAQVLMLGLGPYLDGVSARAVDKTLEVRAKLTEPELDDIIARLGALLTLMRQGRTPGFGR